jgi:DNA-binding NtrC family response regulator
MIVNVIQLDDEGIFHDKLNTLLKDEEATRFRLKSYLSFEEMIKNKSTLKAADIFIVDFELKSKKTGADVIKYLRSKFPHTPSILITSHTKTEYIEEALKAGAVDFLWKSSLNKEFLRSIIVKYSRKTAKASSIPINLESLPFPVAGKTLKNHLHETLQLLDKGPTIRHFEGEKGVGKTHFYRALKGFLDKNQASQIVCTYWDCSDLTIKIDEAFRFENDSANSSKNSPLQHWIFFDNLHQLNRLEQKRLYEQLSDNFVLYRRYNLKVLCTSYKSLYHLAEEDQFNSNLASLLSLYQRKIEPYRERSRDEKIELIGFLLNSVTISEKELSIPSVELLVHMHFKLENLTELKKALTFMVEESSSRYLTPGFIPRYLISEENKTSAVGPRITLNDKTLLNSNFEGVLNEVLAVFLQQKISSLPYKDRSVSNLSRCLGLNRKTLTKKLNILLENNLLDPKFDIRERH